MVLLLSNPHHHYSFKAPRTHITETFGHHLFDTMRVQLAILAVSLPTTLATCYYRGRKCDWVGTAPFCGYGGYEIGQMRHGREVVEITYHYGRDTACDRLEPYSDDCCGDYGESCAGDSYKALLCDV